MISEKLKDVRRRIGEAAARAGKKSEEIILICVTKTVGVPEMEEAVSAGATDVGESYVQDAAAKFRAIGSKVRWHLIGHLQTNKAKEAVEVFDLIHSVDSFKLAQEISKRSAVLGAVKEILIEVKTSEEATKYGVAPAELSGLIGKISLLPNIKVMGLMTMAPFSEEPERSRPYFRKLKELSDEISAKKIDNVDMRYLSMGMTQDFEVAIEEGANMVRVGRAIFGE